jgi:hypothetical protein
LREVDWAHRGVKDVLWLRLHSRQEFFGVPFLKDFVRDKDVTLLHGGVELLSFEIVARRRRCVLEAELREELFGTVSVALGETRSDVPFPVGVRVEECGVFETGNDRRLLFGYLVVEELLDVRLKQGV